MLTERHQQTELAVVRPATLATMVIVFADLTILG